MVTELAVASGEFAQTASDLSSSDIGKQLSISLAGLAEVEQKAHDIQNTQAEQDMVTLMSTGEILFTSVFLFLMTRRG
jgi:sorting nexin-1/2